MRFRLSGTGWKVAPSLARLLIQVDEEWPARHAADGTLGNAAHSNRISDHNPDLLGIVRAGDVGEVTEDDAFALAEAVRLSRDVRVKYVIHERRMYSYYEKNGVPPFTWREYTGSNGHWSHVHFSTRDIYDNDTRPWSIGGDNMGFSAEEVEVLKDLVDSVKSESSNGSFAGYAIRLIRKERKLPLHTKNVTQCDDCIKRGETVTLN